MTRVVVFDMGGVLFDFQGDRLIARTSRRARRFRREEVQDTWVPLVKRFETGASSESEFAAAVVSEYDLSLEPTQFLNAFRDAAVGFYSGALPLLSELKPGHRLVSLSNTNAVQWPVVLAALGKGDPFHAHYPSHLSGFHKPDPLAFSAVVAAHAPGTEFYFFDDRPMNVSAAAQHGWTARCVRGVAATRAACAELGLLR